MTDIMYARALQAYNILFKQNAVFQHLPMFQFYINFWFN